MNRTPNLLLGALVGLLVTAPLVAIGGALNVLFGLPYMPFDIFPVIRDSLPGGLLTIGIDTMVNTIIALNLGRVDTAAKTAEQAMSVAMLVGIGVLAGAIYFAIMNRAGRQPSTVIGLIVGLVFGVVMAQISAMDGLSSTTGQPFLDAVYLIVSFGVWGLALGWIYGRLAQPAEATATSTPAATTTAS